MALTYGEISAITQKLYIPKLVDNIFDSNALWQRARKKWYRSTDGGTTIMEPLLYATTSNAGWYSGSETLDNTSNDQITSAEFNWKQLYASIAITRLDELKNAGKSQVVNFVQAKVQAAEKTMMDTIGTGMYSDGTTDTQSIVGTAMITAATGTYGGIAKATYSWWQGQVDSTTTVLSLQAMQSMFGDCSIDNDKPTVIMTTQDVYDKNSCRLSRKLESENRAKSVNPETGIPRKVNSVKSVDLRNAYHLNLFLQNIIVARVSETLTNRVEG